MNDALRGIVIAVASGALYYALRLAWVYLSEFIRNSRRRHIALHVFWLTCGLAVNASLAVATEVDRTGTNDPVQWKEWLRLYAHLFILFGLVPLWRQHQRQTDRREATP